MEIKKHKFSFEHIKDLIEKGLTLDKFRNIKNSLKDSGVSEHNLRLLEKELEHYEKRSPEYQKKLVEIDMLIHSKREELKRFDKWIDKPYYRIFFDKERHFNKILFLVWFFVAVVAYHLIMSYGSQSAKNIYGIIGFVLFFYVIGLLYLWREHEELKDAIHDLELIKNNNIQV